MIKEVPEAPELLDSNHEGTSKSNSARIELKVDIIIVRKIIPQFANLCAFTQLNLDNVRLEERMKERRCFWNLEEPPDHVTTSCSALSTT